MESTSASALTRSYRMDAIALPFRIEGAIIPMEDNAALIEKVLNDNTFCQSLVANPEDTLRGYGVEPTPEVVAAFRGLDAASLQRLVGAFGKQQAAF